MSSKGRKTERRIVFCEILSVLLLIGLSAGFAWGENQVCSGCHHHSWANLLNFRWIDHESRFDKALAGERASSDVKEKILTRASVTEGFDEEQAERTRITRILLIGTLIGGILFLGRCL